MYFCSAFLTVISSVILSRGLFLIMSALTLFRSSTVCLSLITMCLSAIGGVWGIVIFKCFHFLERFK